ncbi:TPA: cellulose biosynthesis protein BcsO [Citrobacter freundii]|nr:cellulose biosynthesis protein BcsO [Citrobacter freundii]
MRDYNDIQRFKSKTGTQDYDFKDFLVGQQFQESTGWLLIKRLLNDNQAGQYLSVLSGKMIPGVTVPQPVSTDFFSVPGATEHKPLILSSEAHTPVLPPFVQAAELPLLSAVDTLSPVNVTMFSAGNISANPVYSKKQRLLSFLEKIASCR